MDFEEYQRIAANFDVAADDAYAVIIPLLGLAGEAGSLLSEYKKFLRDGSAHERFKDHVVEDLGDLLWYVSTVARRFDLSLEAVARRNLEKITERWSHRTPGNRHKMLDDASPERERLPRKFEVTFKEVDTDKGTRVTMTRDGILVGDPLSDNARDDDGYRFHDVFHLSYAAVLGWSPIMRSLMSVRRLSDRTVNEVEDGARAKIIEELVSQLVFNYARSHNFLEGVEHLDDYLLRTIQSLVADREVNIRTLAEWETAILQGYDVWRSVRRSCGGRVEVNLLDRSIAFAGT